MQIEPYKDVYYRLKDGKPFLIGSKCRKCNYVAFPRKVICPACIAKDSMAEIELGRFGRIDTFSILHVAAPGFSAPYAVARIHLPEGPMIFSMMNLPPSGRSLEVGDEVELAVGKIREDEKGDEIIGYKFQLREGKAEGGTI
jgi:uncharacterized OB-fold protein